MSGGGLVREMSYPAHFRDTHPRAFVAALPNKQALPAELSDPATGARGLPAGPHQAAV